MELLILFLSLFSKTSADVLDFVLVDQTNTIPYSSSFNCVQFSETLIENAEKEGFKAEPVMVGWWQDGQLILHEFVAFETKDGTIWIEPQNDNQYIVSEQSLCYTNGECVTNELAFVY